MSDNEVRNAIETLVNLLFLIRLEAEQAENVRELADMAEAPLSVLLAHCKSLDETGSDYAA